MQHIRGLYKIDLSASRHWQELVQQLTHDRWGFFQVSLAELSSILKAWCTYIHIYICLSFYISLKNIKIQAFICFLLNTRNPKYLDN